MTFYEVIAFLSQIGFIAYISCGITTIIKVEETIKQTINDLTNCLQFFNQYRFILTHALRLESGDFFKKN